MRHLTIRVSQIAASSARMSRICARAPAQLASPPLTVGFLLAPRMLEILRASSRAFRSSSSFCIRRKCIPPESCRWMVLRPRVQRPCECRPLETRPVFGLNPELLRRLEACCLVDLTGVGFSAVPAASSGGCRHRCRPSHPRTALCGHLIGPSSFRRRGPVHLLIGVGVSVSVGVGVGLSVGSGLGASSVLCKCVFASCSSRRAPATAPARPHRPAPRPAARHARTDRRPEPGVIVVRVGHLILR